MNGEEAAGYCKMKKHQVRDVAVASNGDDKSNSQTNPSMKHLRIPSKTLTAFAAHREQKRSFDMHTIPYLGNPSSDNRSIFEMNENFIN